MPIYLPLTVADTGPRAPQSFRGARPLRTACCGTESHLFGQIYAYSYPEAISRILTETGGTHLHIGYLDPAFRAQITAHLQRRGLAAERFHLIEHAENLGQCLGEFDIDLYLPSFPVGCCAETIEVMASGTPVLSHRNYLSAGSTTDEIVYPEARRWRDFADLTCAVRAISRDELVRHSALARAHYEAHHAPAVLEKAFDTYRPVGLPAPTATENQPDYTQLLFDTQSLTAKLKG